MYINDQTDAFMVDGVPMKDISVGKGNISLNGCGVIAAYNVIMSAGLKDEFVKVKDDVIALRGLNLFGLLGARPGALKQYMKRRFPKVWSMYGRSKCWEEKTKDMDAVIILLKWKRSLRMHYTAGIKVKNGYTFYNSGVEDGKEMTLNEFLLKARKDRATPIYCIGIKTCS